MKAAFSTWDNRIAPVFDVARQLHVVESASGRIAGEATETLADEMPAQKALRLSELGIGILVCGAISQPLQTMIAAYGIQVIPFVAGDLHTVIRAWLARKLGNDIFAMPGCCGRSRLRGVHGVREDYMANGRRGGGNNGGMGSRGGGGQGGRGRMGGSFAAGTGGVCLCPQCGHEEPHERGMPCTQRQCPKCGTVMRRK